MAVQLSGVSLPNHCFLQHPSSLNVGRRSLATFASTTHLHSSPIIQIVGGSSSQLRHGNDSSILDSAKVEDEWFDLETDLNHWIKALRPVQWYPGHIAKTERELKEQLKLMDVVVEVRDARIPMSTSHPQMDLWIGNRKRIIVLNREDVISTSDRNAWAAYFAKQGIRVVFSNGKLGMGSMKLSRLAKSLAVDVNVKRRARGLLPRPVSFPSGPWHNLSQPTLCAILTSTEICKVDAEIASFFDSNFGWNLQKDSC